VGPAAAAVGLWAESNTVKVAPDAPRAEATDVWNGERVAIKAARGEWESFQLVVRSDETRQISFRIYDLEGLRGTLAGSHVRVFREVYVPVDWPSVDPSSGFTVGARGRWPDALVPVVGHVDVAGGENTVLWFDIYVPADTFAGKYKGRLEFKWSGGAATVPLELTVWDFVMPSPGRYSFLAGLDEDEVCRLYGIKAAAEEGRAVIEKYKALMAEHFVTAADAEEAAGVATFSFAEGAAYPEAVAAAKRAGGEVRYRAGGLADYIDRPASDHRLIAWAAWRFRGDGLWLEDVSYFPGKGPRPLDAEPRNRWGNGARALLYPPPEAGSTAPLPSVRLKLAREAAEDYEYLAMLDDAGLGRYADELAAAVVPVAPRYGELEPATFYRAREAAALALVKAKWGQSVGENTIAGRVVDDEDEPVVGAVVRAGPLATVTDDDGRYEIRYIPRGRPLVATAPGYERGGAAGAGGRGDISLRRGLWRYIFNDGAVPPKFSAKGFAEAGAVADGNAAGGPALRGWLKGGREGRFAFRPPLSDWRTFVAAVFELYNGGAAAVTATVRCEDDAGAYYEEVFLLAPGKWTRARLDLAVAGERVLLKVKGSGGNLTFEEGKKINLAAVAGARVALGDEGGAEVRLGRVWLEAKAKR